jgi:predicted O-methyltransferase YrrM
VSKESDVLPHHPDERAELFSANDGVSSEHETCRFLFALVRSFKPEVVLETGCHKGLATVQMAEACEKNGLGKVIAVDLYHEWIEATSVVVHGRKLDRYVEYHQEDSVAYIRRYDGPPFGLVFLDSDPMVRVREMHLLRKRKLAMGPVLVHDTSRLRIEGGQNSDPRYIGGLDQLDIPYVENPFARGWRLYDFSRLR